MTHDEKQCREIFALLSQYLDLELPPDACAEIDRHMAGCLPCVEFADSLKRTVDLCRKYEPDTMPAPLNENAKAELQAAWNGMLAARRQQFQASP